MRVLAQLLSLLAMAAPAGTAMTPAGTARAPAHGPGFRVWLLTVAPGREAYSRFGHSALRIADRRSGGDVVFDFGTFDEEQPNVLLRFLQSRLVYSLSVSTFRETLTEVRSEGRRLTAQELRLTPAESLRLFRRLRRLDRPGRRSYAYHHFRRNCATRIRDELDAVLGGVLGKQLRGVPTGTYRDWIRRATRGAPWFHLGFDLILTHADRPIDLWDATFAPEALALALDRVRVPWPRDGGPSKPLVRATRTLNPGPGFSAPEAPDSLRWPTAALGALTLLLLLPLLASHRASVLGPTVRLAGAALGGLALIQAALSSVTLFLEGYASLAQFRGNPLLILLPPTGVLLFVPGLVLLRRGREALPLRGKRATWIRRVVALELLVGLLAWLWPRTYPTSLPDLWTAALLARAAALVMLTWASTAAARPGNSRAVH